MRSSEKQSPGWGRRGDAIGTGSARMSGLALLLLLLLCGCGGPPSGPVKYPVEGVVRINGQLAERMAVTLHHEDATVEGNLRYPTAVTDTEGRFVVSSESDRDGAVAGRYRVTFAWLSSSELDAFDQLQGAFSDPKRSLFTVTVPVEQAAGLEFALEVPESKLRRPREAGR